LVLAVSFPLALVLSVLLLALIRFNILSYGVLPAETWPIAAVALVAYGVGAGLRYWLLRAREFRAISEVSVLQGFARAILPLMALLAPIGWLGLVIGELGGRFAGLFRMLRRSSSAILTARTHGLPPIRRAAAAYWKFPAVSVPSSLVEGLSVSLPLILIAHLFGEVSAGLFFLVQRVVSLPAAFVTTSIADVYHTKMAERFRTERSEMRALFVATSKSLATLACVVVLPFAILLTLGFSRLFGAQWSQGGALVLVLAPWTIGGLIVSPVSRILLITQKLEHKLAYDLFTLVSTYAALYGAHQSNLSFVQGVTLLSAVRVVGYGGYFYVLLRAASLKREINHSDDGNDGRYA
jgi:lipopolysaccharide exporter